MPRGNYDPAKAHEYYLKNRELKGRKKGAAQQPSSQHKSGQPSASAQQKVASIEAKLSKLRALLQAKIAESKSSGSDKKATPDKMKARQNSKEYYNKHKNEIKNDNAAAARKSGGSSSSGGTTASSMSESELRTAIQKTVVQLKQAIADARSPKGGGG